MSSSTRAHFAVMAVSALIATAMFGIFAAPATAAPKSVNVIREVAAQHNVSAADQKALIKLAKRESSWNPKARNGSCRGLFQVKTKSKRWADPAFNTSLALKYIKKRYGTPRKALAHSYSHGWY